MRFRRMFNTIDTHTCGQPTRTIIGGLPHIPGETIIEKMMHLKENEDWIRKLLMFEPRGNDVMSGVILTEPCSKDADIGVIFIEVGGYLPMCGHDTIGVSTALIESGIVKAVEPYTNITLDTPAGIVRVKVKVTDGVAEEVTFTNIPSFVFEKDINIEVPGLGNVLMDISYGGNVYAIVKAADVGLELNPKETKKIIEYGNIIRDAVNKQIKIQHPEKDFINEVTHVEFAGLFDIDNVSCRNTVVIPDGSLDRSPCGTGSSAKLASLYLREEIKLNQYFIHESIIGTKFKCRALKETTVGKFNAIIPEITGSAHVTGMHTFVLDANDPMQEGFKLG